MVNSQESYAEIRKILDSQIEWLIIDSTGRSFAVQNNELEIELSRDKLLFGFLDARGFQTWRVVDWKSENDKLIFHLSKHFNREKAKIELVPRVSSKEFKETVELARIEKANKLAGLIIENEPRSKLIRVELNKENGRFAQIVCEDFKGKQTVVLADVSETLTPEILLTSAILQLIKLQSRKKNPIEKILILAESKVAKSLQKLYALLRANWQRKIIILEISKIDAKEETKLKELETLVFASLFNKRKKKVETFEIQTASETAQKLVEISTDEIDVLQSQHGETVYYHGLPFARIRKVLNSEKIWFGIEGQRRLLSAGNYAEFAKIIDELKTYRRHDSPNKQHFYYKNAPEAWLESILRRNIKALDANLILSPLHDQFRAERDKIDLLAIRRDGRIVIIEVKTAPDREMIFQAADYWRKIEAERRAGNLQKAKIFGNLEIKDEPALVYLVAPLLSYHKDFDFLAKTISPEIEIYRFDANENWRENLKIVRREKSHHE
jgi:hypothetical protein